MKNYSFSMDATWLSMMHQECSNAREVQAKRLGFRLVQTMLLMCFAVLGFAQTTLLSENMGTPTATTAIASNTFQSASPIAFGGTADVRITTASTNSGASGGGNIFFGISGGHAKDFLISGINTSAHTSLSLSFGVLATSANNMLVVEYSTDGTTYTALTVNATISANTWTAKTATGTIPSTSNLRIRFSKSSAVSFRLDDVKLTGTASSTATLTAVTLDSALLNTYGTAVNGVNFSAAGTNLTGNITVTPSSGYEVSTTSASASFSTSALSVASGSNNVWIRSVATKSVSTFNSTIVATLSDGGATSSVNITTSASGNQVTAKALTITGLTGNNKVYDGNATALVSGSASLNGIVGTDMVSLSGTPVYTFDSANAGNNIGISVSGYSLTGSNALNYTLNQLVNLSANIEKANQTMASIVSTNAVLFGDPAYSVSTTSSAGLTVTYSTSDAAVVSVNASGMVSINGVGTATITASQSGDANYNPATDVTQEVTVGKANQSIAFNPLANKTTSDPSFALTGTASSGLTVSYTSSDTNVAKVSGSTVSIFGVGTSQITASQLGTTNYNAALPVVQSLSVTLPACSPNAGTATWNFGTSAPGSALPSISGSNFDVDTFKHGNPVGPFATTWLSTTSPSSGYVGASASYNAANTFRVGGFSKDTSTYYEFKVTPTNGYKVSLTGINFAYHVTETGPKRFGLRSNLDNYASDIVTDTLSAATSTWAFVTKTSLSASNPQANSPIIFRLYCFDGTGSPSSGSANMRVDDVVLNLSLSNEPSIATVSSSVLYSCGLSSSALPGLAPTTGIGKWSQVSGPGSTVFSDSTSASSIATVTHYGTYTYRWTVYSTTCSNSSYADVTATYNESPTYASVSTEPPLCYNTNGAILFSATGGNGTISYLVNGVTQTSPFATLAGTYTIIASDVNACSITSIISLTQPDQLQVINSVTPGLCYGDNSSLSFSSIGGTAPITYLVDGMTTSPVSLSAGVYTVTATDINLCTATSVVNIVSTPAINLVADATSASCFGSSGSVSFSATGGIGTIIYTVNGSAASSPYSAAAGTYTIIASDANSCSTQTVITVSNSSNLPTAALSGSNIICSGNSTTLTLTFTGTAPWTYAINNGTPVSTSTNPLNVTVSPNTTTSYAITYLSDANCVGTSNSTATVTVQSCGNAPVITSSLTHSVVYRTNAPVYTIQATNAPVSFNTVGLPAGLTINQNTGVISGTTSVEPGQYTVTVSATNQQGTGNAYLVISVLPKPLTVAGISVPSKVYDATTLANVNGTPILVGIVQNDNVSVSGILGAQYATKNVGNNIVVSITGLTLSGTKASCYTLINPTLLGNITPRNVSVSGLIIPEKVYDGTTSATIAGAPLLIGKMPIDSLTANMLNAIATFNNPNYGYNKQVNIAGITLGGTDAANYTITQPNNLVSSIICNQPAIVSITSTGNSSLVAWTSNGANSYTFSYKELGTPSWISISTSDTTTSINGLKAATTYEYRLRLSCTPNVNSNWVIGQFTTNSGCGLPSINTPLSVSGNLATVSWSSTADSGFQLYLRPQGATLWGASYWSNTTTRQFTNLTPNTNYEYSVRSFCKNGDISMIVIGQFTTTAGCSPTTINAPLSVAGSMVHLSWNGNTDSIYQVALKPSTSPDWTMYVYTTNTNRVITGLMPNTNYSYAIRALCAGGDQGAWAYGQVTTTVGCGVPILLAPSPIHGNSALINWTGTSDSVFQINFKLSTSPLWDATVYSANNSEWLTNLLPNTSYDYRIRSICQNNDQSVWVNGSFTTTNTCGAVTLNAPITITSQSAVLSWNGSTDSVYNIFIRPVGAANWGARFTTASTVRQFTNLQSNTQYEYRIRSVCKNKDVSTWVFGQFTTNNSKGFTDTATFELLSFHGLLNANNHIDLSWITLNESAGNSYIVEHSANQEPFEVIAQINAKATNNSDPNNGYQYKLSHNSPKEGLHQYRIRIKSIDGTWRMHSEWVEINVMWFINNVQVYPNPAVNTTNISFASPINSQLTYQLRDLAGRLIKTIVLPINQGENQVPVDLSNMPNGVYMLQLYQSNQTIQTVRLTVSH